MRFVISNSFCFNLIIGNRSIQILTKIKLLNETAGVYKYRKQSFKLGTNGVGIVGSYESWAGESKLIYLIKESQTYWLLLR